MAHAACRAAAEGWRDTRKEGANASDVCGAKVPKRSIDAATIAGAPFISLSASSFPGFEAGDFFFSDTEAAKMRLLRDGGTQMRTRHAHAVFALALLAAILLPVMALWKLVCACG